MSAQSLSGAERSTTNETPGRVSVAHDLLVMRRDDTVPNLRSEPALYLDHPTVSRCHARFFVRMGAMCIEDLGSTTGTWVNSERISHATRLNSGDRISIGTFLLLFDGTGVEIRSHTAGATLGAYSIPFAARRSGERRNRRVETGAKSSSRA